MDQLNVTDLFPQTEAFEHFPMMRLKTLLRPSNGLGGGAAEPGDIRRADTASVMVTQDDLPAIEGPDEVECFDGVGVVTDQVAQTKVFMDPLFFEGFGDHRHGFEVAMDV